MRFRNIEFRWNNYNQKYELLRWYEDIPGKEICYVIAFFDKGKEGYDLRTVGSRFFEDKDAFVVGKYAIEFLNAMSQQLRDEEELE